MYESHQSAFSMLLKGHCHHGLESRGARRNPGIYNSAMALHLGKSSVMSPWNMAERPGCQESLDRKLLQCAAVWHPVNCIAEPFSQLRINWLHDEDERSVAD
jgi:hypothetical protein